MAEISIGKCDLSLTPSEYSTLLNSLTYLNSQRENLEYEGLGIDFAIVRSMMNAMLEAD